MKKAFVFLTFISSFLLFSREVGAVEGSWSKADFLKARLVAVPVGRGDPGAARGILEIQMEPGWHVYWRTPGDGGLPPMLEWEGSGNLETAVMAWPAPKRFEYEGLYGFGYRDTVAFPLTFTPKDAAKPITLTMQGDVMACKDLCVPQAVTVSLDIPVGSAMPDSSGPLIEKAFENLPHQGNLPGLKIDTAVLGPEALAVRAYAAGGWDGADLFAEAGTDFYLTARPTMDIDQKDPRYATLRIAAPEGVGNLADAIAGKTLILTLTSGRDAIERRFDF